MSKQTTPLCIKVHAQDTVAVIANDGGLKAGTAVPGGPVLTEDIPQAHKVALKRIAKDEPVLRYGVPIGYARQDIPAGAWVTEELLRMPPSPELDDIPLSVYEKRFAPLERGYTFQGYRNADGSVGTRNILALTTTVQCVAGIVDLAVDRIKRELLPKFPNVDDVVAIQHIYGCGVAIDAPDAYIPIRTLRNIMANPNFGGMPLMVSLGCEKLPPDKLLPQGSLPLQGHGTDSVCLQDEELVGCEAMLGAILSAAENKLRVLDQRKRETCPASDLCVGLQCGGSDAFSGLTANPAIGYAADLIVRAGGTVYFSENTEVRDGVEILVARAASRDVGEALKREMRWYDNYLAKGGVDRSANTTPGNKKGGLNNITEKTMGSIVKSGSAPIVGVVPPGERIPKGGKGLYYVATPASDFVCGTLQVAAGMNVHVFSTGRGTPYSLREVPVIKVATRNDLARRWHDLMEVNAGTIATGERGIEDVGMEIFQLILDVASGKKTWGEHWGYANSLALFNPAPIT